jgi:hypothetical protein
MGRFLSNRELWTEIRKQANSSKVVTIVTGYLGTKPQALLKWPRNGVVVADISADTVKYGICSAKGALALSKKGISVLQLKNLHAKIYLFDRTAIVGSANLSEESSDRRVEAGVLLSGKEVKTVRTEVRRIKRSATLLDADILTAWAKHEPKRKRVATRPVGPSTDEPERSMLNGSPLWLVDTWKTDPSPAEERVRAKTSRKLAEDHGVDSKHIDWFGSCGESLFKAVKPGDWIMCWWQESTRAPHGKLEGPFECLGPVDFGRSFGEERYALALVPNHARTVLLDNRRFGRVRKILGDWRLKRSDVKLRSQLIKKFVKVVFLHS